MQYSVPFVMGSKHTTKTYENHKQEMYRHYKKNENIFAKASLIPIIIKTVVH